MRRQRFRQSPQLTNANRLLILKYSCGIYKIFGLKASYCVASLLLLFLGGSSIMSAARKKTVLAFCPWKERKEPSCYKRATTGCSWRTQLQQDLPGTKATKKGSLAREKFNRFQLTWAKCSQEDFFPFDITTVLYVMVQCHHGTAFLLFDGGK